MSSQSSFVASLTPGAPLEASAVPTTNDCSGVVQLSNWNVGVFSGQLQGSVNITPSNAQSAIVSAVLLITSQNGLTIYTSGVATIGGGGAPGQMVGLNAYTNLFNAGTQGSTVSSVVYGYVLTSSGSCTFYQQQYFNV